MKRHLPSFIVGCQLFVLGGCATPEDGPAVFEHDGLERSYHLHAPRDRPEEAPLVVVMHGYGGNGDSMRTQYGWVELADREGFAVCFPDGTVDDGGRPFWNVGYERHLESEVDDTAFIVALVGHLQERHDLDAERTFATGLSNGGDLSIQLSARASEHFAAIGPVVGTMMESLYRDCDPSIPRPMIAFNGTDDRITRFDGDIENADGWGPYRSMPEVVTLWSGLLGTTEVETIRLPDRAPDDGSVVEFERHHGADHGRELHLYRVVGGGHDWPGAYGNMDVDATELIWAFFESVGES